MAQSGDPGSISSTDRQTETPFRLVATATVVTTLAAYFVFMAETPQCGPIGNSFLGRIYFVVPLALLAAQAVVIVVGAIWTQVSATRATVAVLFATALGFAGEVVIFWAFLGVGGCTK
jgi:hypothetical protein